MPTSSHSISTDLPGCAATESAASPPSLRLYSYVDTPELSAKVCLMEFLPLKLWSMLSTLWSASRSATSAESSVSSTDVSDVSASFDFTDETPVAKL